MKKVILAIVALLGFTVSGFAQTEAKKAVQKSQAVAKEVKKDVKAAEAKAAEAKAREARAAEAKAREAKAKEAKDAKVVLKKDGTPDKRYKEGKRVKLKKDGTPDRRYKNK